MTLSLEQKAAAIRKTCEHIRKLRELQEEQLRALEFQASLMEQGIDPESVETYGYDPTLDKRLKNRRATDSRLTAVVNYVRLKSEPENKIILAEPINKP